MHTLAELTHLRRGCCVVWIYAIALLWILPGCSTQQRWVTPLPQNSLLIASEAEASRRAEDYLRATGAWTAWANAYHRTEVAYDSKSRRWSFFYSRLKPGEKEVPFDHSWFTVVVEAWTGSVFLVQE